VFVGRDELLLLQVLMMIMTMMMMVSSVGVMWLCCHVSSDKTRYRRGGHCGSVHQALARLNGWLRSC